MASRQRDAAQGCSTMSNDRAKARANYRVLRRKILEILGNKYNKCGVSDERVLQVNHINGRDRDAGVWDCYSTHDLYRDIVNGKRKYDLNLLCANCNIIHEYERGNRSLV